MGELAFHPVDHTRWDDLAALFDARGGPRSCWCMVWRAQGEEAKRTDRPSRRKALHRRVAADEPVGLLGYLDGEPAAWCSIAPRETYRPLGGPPEPEDGVWSLICFYVPRRLRGQGLTDELIGAAIDHARAGGGAVVEAYPVDPDSPSYRFMGFVPTFARLGFEEVGTAGTRRHVMRLAL